MARPVVRVHPNPNPSTNPNTRPNPNPNPTPSPNPNPNQVWLDTVAEFVLETDECARYTYYAMLY